MLTAKKLWQYSSVIIVLLKYKGTPVFASEKHNQPQEVNFGKAFYNEFGIDTALGFSEAMIGGAFHKIGVGILKKTTATYDFMHAYEITPCKFSYSSEDNSCLLYTSPSPRDRTRSRMPSSA